MAESTADRCLKFDHTSRRTRRRDQRICLRWRGGKGTRAKKVVRPRNRLLAFLSVRTNLSKLELNNLDLIKHSSSRKAGKSVTRKEATSSDPWGLFYLLSNFPHFYIPPLYIRPFHSSILLPPPAHHLHLQPLCTVTHSHQGVATHDIGCTKGVDIGLICGWYPYWYPAVGFGRNIAVFSNFQVFNTLNTGHWYLANIRVYQANIFWYSAIIWQILSYMKNWLTFSWYPFNIPLISLTSWYPVNWFPARCYPLIHTIFISTQHAPLPNNLKFTSTERQHPLILYIHRTSSSFNITSTRIISPSPLFLRPLCISWHKYLTVSSYATCWGGVVPRQDVFLYSKVMNN